MSHSAHKCQTSWLATAAMWNEGGEYKQFEWLDSKHGWLQLSVHGSWDQAIALFLNWRNRLHEHKTFVMQLLVPNGLDDVDVRNCVQRLQLADAKIAANPVLLVCSMECLVNIARALIEADRQLSPKGERERERERALIHENSRDAPRQELLVLAAYPVTARLQRQGTLSYSGRSCHS